MSDAPDSPWSETGPTASGELDNLLHERLEQAPIGLFETDERGACVFVNRQLCALSGLSAEQALGWGWIEAVHPEDREGLLAEWNHALQAGGELEHEFRLGHADGRMVWCLVRAVARRERSGRTRGHLGAVIDIDDRRQAVDALRQSEQRYRALVERSPDGIVAMVDNVVLYSNPSAARQLGVREPRELVGRRSIEFVHPDFLSLVHERRALELGGAELPAAEILLVRDDGSTLPVEYFSVATEYAGQRARQLVVRDISERKEAAAELAASQARMRALLKAVPDLIFLLDRDGVYVDHHAPDPGALALPWDALRGRRLFDFLPAGAGAELARLEDEARRTGELQICHLALPACGESREFEIRVATVNDTRWLMIARDVTVARRAEHDAARLAERMRETQKLESLGVLAGGIAHDFNNILTTILGFADLGLLELPADSPLRHNLEQISAGARNAAELTRQLLAYSGQGMMTLRPLDLAQLVAEMDQLLGISVGHHRTLRREIDSDLPLVEADATQLRQVLLNLVLNAAEATAGPDGDGSGSVTLRLSDRTCDAQTLSGSVLHDELPAGRYLVIEVVDQGPGMDESTRSRMFEPFFSTKFPGRGLGLAAVLGIVRSHRGTLDVDSRPGGGTTIRVYLPAYDRSASAQARQAAAGAWRGAGKALVVDDEPAVRALAGVMLERLGFEVASAQDGAQALDLLRGRESDARLVLLDITMPQLDGLQTLLTIRALRPELPVVLSSGYHDAATLLHGQAPADGFVKKPYRFDELREIVRAALGE